ncbi:MAG TPA: NAD(P)/FAD-dependent oxidoreductase [Polyangia bacterium]
MVIVGGGFGGFAAARALAHAEVNVVVLDRSNHHLFQPLLYQVATALLNEGDIATALRRELRAPNVDVVLAEVVGFDLERRVVACEGRDVPFDYLVIAAGATHSYFGHDEWAAHAPGLKSIEDALEIRRRILLALELAERARDAVEQQAHLTFVVVGGGPTGVELAGALADLTRHTRRGEFKHVNPSRARIVLLEGLPRLLTAWPEQLGERARRDLESRGVEVRTGTFVTHVDGKGVRAGDEEIAARTVLWGAGVKPSPLGRALGVPVDKAGRVPVTPHLSVPDHPNVFVIGDLAAVHGEDGQAVPGLAGAAIQQGHQAAGNVLLLSRGRAARPFRYRDRGSFAVIGRGAAVGTLARRWRLNGLLGWLAWLGIHFVLLTGVRNRLSVLLGWTYALLTRRRPMWLLAGGHREVPRGGPEQAPEKGPLAPGFGPHASEST